MAYKIIQYLPTLITRNHQNVIQFLNNPLKKTIPRRAPGTRNFTTDNCNENENLSVMLHGVKDMRIENRPMPKFRDNQVLLQMETIGICGSDVHLYLDGHLGSFVVKEPMVIGHEASGTVLECGKDVTDLTPGDRVAIEPQMNCKKCHFCKSGNYHLCPNLYFCAAPPDHGNLSRYYVHDWDFCHKLPGQLDLEHGTLMEPLAVGVHACKRAEVTSGDSILIIGSGPIGLVSVLAAKAYGASKIVVVDIDEFKIQKALEMGADAAIDLKRYQDKDIIKAIHDVFGHHPHKTIECSGQEQAMKVGLEATRSGGKLVLVGMGINNANLPISECIFREVDILGVFRYVNDYPTAIDMVESGKIDPKPLITHHFKLEDSLKAFTIASCKKEPYIKILIHANPKWQPSNDKPKDVEKQRDSKTS